MKKLSLYISVLVLLFISSCKSNLDPKVLYGKWKYIKVENPHMTPPDSVSSSELAIQAPSIQFNTNSDFVIMWGGKILSHGKFGTEGQNIIIKEVLPGGKTRIFPFWVSKLTDKDLIFETGGRDGSRVTAVKEL